MKKLLLTLLLAMVTTLGASADETQVEKIVKNGEEITVVTSRWSKGDFTFFICCNQHSDGRKEYRIAVPVYLLNDHSHVGIDKNDNCLVRLADGTVLELPNSTGYNLYDTMYNDWRCSRKDYPQAFTFIVDYGMTTEQYQKLLTQGIKGLRVEHKNGFKTYKVKTSDFIKDINELDSEINKALTGDNILDDF